MVLGSQPAFSAQPAGETLSMRSARAAKRDAAAPPLTRIAAFGSEAINGRRRAILFY